MQCSAKGLNQNTVRSEKTQLKYDPAHMGMDVHICDIINTIQYIHAYIHTYIHTYMHTYIHTCIHTYIQIETLMKVY
jgi:hypothetical protein